MISSSLWLLTNENLTPKESTLLNNTIIFAYEMVKVSSQSVFEIENSQILNQLNLVKFILIRQRTEEVYIMQDIINSLAEVAAIKKENESLVFL